mmetsp:Transcript_6114/g.14656  ORF Transcript_6114/g.14656 Transcript_6114/m.14656 type:complete len:258 (+) Transcript_6114:170-943(+)
MVKRNHGDHKMNRALIAFQPLVQRRLVGLWRARIQHDRGQIMPVHVKHVRTQGVLCSEVELLLHGHNIVPAPATEVQRPLKPGSLDRLRVLRDVPHKLRCPPPRVCFGILLPRLLLCATALPLLLGPVGQSPSNSHVVLRGLDILPGTRVGGGVRCSTQALCFRHKSIRISPGPLQERLQVLGLDVRVQEGRAYRTVVGFYLSVQAKSTRSRQQRPYSRLPERYPTVRDDMRLETRNADDAEHEECMYFGFEHGQVE